MIPDVLFLSLCNFPQLKPFRSPKTSDEMEGDKMQTIEMRSTGKAWAVEPAQQYSDSKQQDAADMRRMGKAQEFRVR